MTKASIHNKPGDFTLLATGEKGIALFELKGKDEVLTAVKTL